MKSFGKKELYNLHHIGSFGRFYSGKSFPVEFLQTSFSASELLDLKFAREVKQDHIDFDLLMQRDIDEERVKTKMEPYIDPDDVTSSEIKSRAIFFPPLLVAIIPVENGEMLSYYSNETCYPDEDNFVREWPGLFKLTFFPSDAADAYQFKDQNGDPVPVDREPVKLSVKTAKGHRKGAMLVVIDGQHRLHALRQVYEKKPSLIEDLVVPVCVLYGPHCTESMQEQYGDVKVPKVSEVFRHLFVDINTTMELVGGHFNILLSDSNIGQLACRRFCDVVLERYGPKGLALVEWNTKNKKESTIIKKSYPITSIGIIDKALDDNFNKRRRQRQPLLKYIAGIENVESEYDEDDDVQIEVEWERFSLSQKAEIEENLKKTLCFELTKIFFESDFYKPIFDVFDSAISEMESLAKEGTDRSVELKRVMNQVLEYVPIQSGNNFEEARNEYVKFENRVEANLENKISPIVRYAIFQRALIQAWVRFLEIQRKASVDLSLATDSFLKLINLAAVNQGSLFAPSHRYMQYSVFSRTKIKPKEDTKDSLANLIMALLGQDENVEKVIADLDSIGSEEKVELKSDLFEVGQDSASKFIEHYKKSRKADFIASYRVDFDNLDPEERERLGDLQDEYEKHKKQHRNGEIPKERISTKFFEEVEKFVQQDLSESADELKQALGYDVDILEDDESDEE